MDRLLNFFAPPKPEHGEDGIKRFHWGVSIGMYVMTLFMAWSLGLGAIVGMEGSGFAKGSQAEQNRASVEELKLTVKCGNLQTQIQSLADSIYEVERQIEIDADEARDSDRRRLSSLESNLRQKEAAFRDFGCATILEG